MSACQDAWAMLSFDEHVRGMAASDDTHTGQCTIQILHYMVCEHGTSDMLRNFKYMGLLRNRYGVAFDMDEVNAHMYKATQTGKYANKSDECDIMWHFNEWLQNARKARHNLDALQHLALEHGRNIYLEFTVMGGGNELSKDAMLCGQWCIDVLLKYLCEDVGLHSDVLLVSSDTRQHDEDTAGTEAASCSTIT